MINKLKDLKATYIFNLIAIILLIGSIFLYNIFEKTKNEIELLNHNSNIKHVTKLSSNIINKIKNTIDRDIYKTLNDNKKLRTELENDLQYFITNRYRYIYLLDKKVFDTKDFRVLLDATVGDDKFDFKESYRPANLDKYNKIYQIKKSLNFKHKDIKSLWMTHLNPIIIDGKVEAILVIDFSIKEISLVSQFLYELDFVYESALVFFILVFIIIVYFSYLDLKREQLKEKVHHELEIKTLEVENESKKVHNLNDTLEHRVNEAVEKNRLQYQQMLQQTKLASMGEMIGNIAHQWRQPLSVISTGATGMQVQKQYGHLSDKEFDDTCTMIDKNAQYLSKTIDDFRNFIKGDRKKNNFNLKNNINSFINLVEGSIKSNDICIILNLQEDININGYENELTQCIINIYNNAQDILIENKLEDKYIFISTFIQNGKVSINIKDNAGGIPHEIIPKIFEPYFTTKHKGQGTGLGLHMTYNLIVDGMDGAIEANNVDYEYDSKNYIGAEFVITLPLS